MKKPVAALRHLVFLEINIKLLVFQKMKVMMVQMKIQFGKLIQPKHLRKTITLVINIML